MHLGFFFPLPLVCYISFNNNLATLRSSWFKYLNKRDTQGKLKKNHLMPSFKIRNLEETLMNTKVEYGQRLAPLNKVILELEAELREVRSQVERHVETNNNLLCVKMKLEAEIDNYQRLIHGMTADTER